MDFIMTTLASAALVVLFFCAAAVLPWGPDD